MASRHRSPLRFFRIADRRHPIFDGTGSFLNGNRWNSKGRRIVYTAETYAGALLEMLVHCNIGYIPHTHAWIEIFAPEKISVERVDPGEIPGWDAADMAQSRAYGDRWHEEERSAILLVPSVVTGGIESNALLNQDHPDFRLLKASDPRDVAWDRRLLEQRAALQS
jgi:RES domain-containing protein